MGGEGKGEYGEGQRILKAFFYLTAMVKNSLSILIFLFSFLFIIILFVEIYYNYTMFPLLIFSSKLPQVISFQFHGLFSLIVVTYIHIYVYITQHTYMYICGYIEYIFYVCIYIHTNTRIYM